MKTNKAILDSVIPSQTEYFDNIGNVSAELNKRQSRYNAMEIDGKRCQISEGGVLDTEAGSFRLREHGFWQMLWMLGIPKGYAKKIPNDLLRHDINRLFQEKGVRTKLVTDGDTVRGFMPAAKVCVPNPLLLTHLTGSLTEHEMYLAQAELSDSSLRLKVLSPSLKMEVPRVGDIYSVGLDICNSDVGETTLSANAFTLCLRCTNGLVAPRDVWGIRKNRFGKGVTADNMLASFMMDVSHVVNKLERMQDCLKKSTELTVTEDQLAVYQRVVKSVILEDEQQKVALGRFSLQSTVYDVQYAITELSKKVEDVLRRRRIEAFAGEMLYGDDRMLVNFSLN